MYVWADSELCDSKLVEEVDDDDADAFRQSLGHHVGNCDVGKIEIDREEAVKETCL